MTAPLLTTKLYIPPIRPALAPRPRLLERLNAGLRGACKLTLISAPAGFGKTTLVSEWLAPSLALPRSAGEGWVEVAWLSLDDDDNDPTRFLAYLIAALETLSSKAGASASLGADARTLLQPRHRAPFKAVITTLSTA